MIDPSSPSRQNLNKIKFLKKTRKSLVSIPPGWEGRILGSFSEELRLRFHLISLLSIRYYFWAFFLEPCVIAKYRSDWPESCRDWNIWEYTRYLQNPTQAIQPSRGRQLRKLLKNRTGVVDPKEARLVHHNHVECERVLINVGGRIYETQIRTLRRFDGTLLGHPQRRVIYYDKNSDWYFFDRNREAFEYILYFYQSGGRLIRPPFIHAELFYKEAEFFDLGAKVLQRYRIEEGLGMDNDLLQYPKNLLMRKIYLILEVPSSSSHAYMLSFISVYIVIAAVLVFCLGTESMFQETRGKAHYRNTTSGTLDTANSLPVNYKDPLDLLELICVFWFAFELTARYISSPHKITFFTRTMNLLDLLAILPYFLNIVLIIFEFHRNNTPTSNLTFAVVSLIRLCQVFRILKLSRYMRSLQVLGWTLRATLKEILHLLSFLFVAVLIFSFAMYIAEGGPGTAFPSIPDGFYWAITTMATVGYGDVVPKKLAGKLVGALCAISGVLVLAFPVPIMTSNFTYYYNQKSNQERSLALSVFNSHVLMCPYLPRDGLRPNYPQKQVYYRSRADSSNPTIPHLHPPKRQSRILYERRMRRLQLLAL